MAKRLLLRSALAEHPARFVVAVFVVAIGLGSLLLWLPWSTPEGNSTDPLTAVFTATSAVCVTGLAVVDTGAHWSPFGQVVLLTLIQLGGLGFMTMASLIAIVLSHRLGLRMTIITSQERGTLSLGDVRRVLRGVGIVTLFVESIVAVVLLFRFHFTYHYGWGKAAWYGVFHSVSAFNNAGFSLYSTSLIRFSSDVIITGTLGLAIIIGGLGFPVLVDLHEQRRARRWDRLAMHSRMTLIATGSLLLIGVVLIAVTEWNNPGTLGGHSVWGKGWLSVFGSITPRTAGFNTIDVGAMTDEGLVGTMMLMFIGAGSAGTSGGIKVGTAAVLALVVWSQMRGSTDVVVLRRRISSRVQREATTVVLLGFAVIGATTWVLLEVSSFPLSDTLFEAISAFGTVGLSTGITPLLPAVGQLTLVAVMLIGRLGPVTLGMALVLKRRPSRIRYPEEAPLIG